MKLTKWQEYDLKREQLIESRDLAEADGNDEKAHELNVLLRHLRKAFLINLRNEVKDEEYLAEIDRDLDQVNQLLNQ